MRDGARDAGQARGFQLHPFDLPLGLGARIAVLPEDASRSGTAAARVVVALRGSDLVVSQSVESLLAAGLVVVEPGDLVRYQPTSDAVDSLASAAEALYATRPDSVRRMIVAQASSGLSSFADAFKLWRE